MCVCFWAVGTATLNISQLFELSPCEFQCIFTTTFQHILNQHNGRPYSNCAYCAIHVFYAKIDKNSFVCPDEGRSWQTPKTNPIDRQPKEWNHKVIWEKSEVYFGAYIRWNVAWKKCESENVRMWDREGCVCVCVCLSIHMRMYGFVNSYTTNGMATIQECVW